MGVKVVALALHPSAGGQRIPKPIKNRSPAQHAQERQLQTCQGHWNGGRGGQPHACAAGQIGQVFGEGEAAVRAEGLWVLPDQCYFRYAPTHSESYYLLSLADEIYTLPTTLFQL